MKKQPVLALRPAQFAMGLEEVREKAHELLKMKKSERRKVLREKPIRVVVGPDRTKYVVDHHHLLFACFCAGIKKVPVKVEKDLSKRKMGFDQFWKYMSKHRYAHLQDQFGEKNRNPVYLPEDVRGLAHDPYRSLAWVVKSHGGFGESQKPFYEFQWANYFRARKILEHHHHSYKEALKEAMKLAHAPAARNLPGYIRPRKAA